MRQANCDNYVKVNCEGVEIWEENDVKVYFPPKASDAHKGSFGKACIITHGERLGAAMLSASACLHSGVGYTFLHVPQEMRVQVATALPSCIVEEMKEANYNSAVYAAIALGMGSGVSEELYAQIRQILQDYRGTLILDADALTALAQFGLDVLKEKSCDVILTPHMGEFARLCGKSIDGVKEGGVALAKDFAKEYGVTLVLKSNHTIITDGERAAINLTGSPALAKAGSGDVLSGLLAGIGARCLPFEAACVACYILGRAGEEAEREFGQYAPTSSDIIALLPRVIKKLEC